MEQKELYQIGLPIDRLSNVMMNYICYEQRQRMLISPSSKQEDYLVVETRHAEFAAAIIKDVPEAKVRILKEARNIRL